jgi:hypothetical protein
MSMTLHEYSPIKRLLSLLKTIQSAKCYIAFHGIMPDPVFRVVLTIPVSKGGAMVCAVEPGD